MMEKPTLGKVLPVQIVTMIISVLAMFIDSLLIGIYLKDDALAAYGLTTPIILFITAYGGMISNGVQVLAGEAAGAGDSERVNRILSTSMILGGVGSLATLLITAVFSMQIAVILGAKADLMVSLTAEYLRGIALCFPMIVAVLIAPTFMQLNGTRKWLVVSAVLLIILDVIFDLINVLLLHGGLLGMALASALSYVLSTAFLFFGFFKNSEYRISLKLFDKSIVKDICRFGLLYLTYKLCQVLLSLSLNRILAKVGGTPYVAANSIIASVNLVTGAFPSGFGSTTTIISSFHYGRRDAQGYRGFVRRIMILSVVVNMIVVGLSVIFAPNIVGLFDPASDKVLGTAVFGLRIFSFSLIPNTINYIVKNSSQSVKNTRRAYVICILNDLVLPLTLAATFMIALPISWIWLCYTAGQLLAVLIVYVMVRTDRSEWCLV